MGEEAIPQFPNYFALNEPQTWAALVSQQFICIFKQNYSANRTYASWFYEAESIKKKSCCNRQELGEEFLFGDRKSAEWILIGEKIAAWGHNSETQE